MNNKGFLRICAMASICALLGGACAGAWAQGGEASPGESSGAMAAPAASTPKEVRKANRALSRKVYAALAKHKEIDAGSISIVARNGAVTLNGTVTEASQIDTVAEVARAVPGVKSVTNRLSVQRPIGQ
ncbi:BON domain-containing protein [Paraburkholderia sp. J63]|uniref:BON domain-containing protein n=1 Tax=Paraburkholderia sp. J63 TaxID=2805434 RepID=UPI002ABDC6F0|nr:BON domain-containing protein [Paraburkholderia sp. J63]